MRPSRAIGMALLLLASATHRTHAQADTHPAAAPEQLGTVHFATSCAPATVPVFDRAVALLHSFEFGAAIQGFEKTLAMDSSCAMAHWGIALSRWSNPFSPGIRSADQLKSGREAVERGEKVSTHATEREKSYISAVGQLYAVNEQSNQYARMVAYARAMQRVASAYPADTEASIFYALSLTASADPRDKTYANQLAAASILERLLTAQPDHPGLTHYLIHSYDVPPLASRGVNAAHRYATIAPSAAHALHMPSHIFTRVGSWDESVQSNVRAIAAAKDEGSIAEVLHASDYAVYAYLQTGEDRAARKILDGLPALASTWDVNTIAGAAPPAAGFFALAAIPARYALERRAWHEAASLQSRHGAFPWTESVTHFARGLGAAHGGDLATARASLDTLGAIHDRLAAAGESYWAEQVAIEQLGVRGWVAHAERRDGDALAALREASTREDATEKSAITPGPLIPARELLGDVLLELHDPAQALVAYRATLEKEPNRFRTLYGAMRAAAQAGDRASAAAYAQTLRAICARGDANGRPELREIREFR